MSNIGNKIEKRLHFIANRIAEIIPDGSIAPPDICLHTLKYEPVVFKLDVDTLLNAKMKNLFITLMPFFNEISLKSQNLRKNTNLSYAVAPGPEPFRYYIYSSKLKSFRIVFGCDFNKLETMLIFDCYYDFT